MKGKEKLAVSGMHCRSCEILITDSVMEMEGVKRIKIDHKTGAAEVEFDPAKTDVERIAKMIREQGYGCKVVV